MDPVIAVLSSFFTIIVGGILGNRADYATCQIVSTIVGRLHRSSAPVNHDLQRAIRKSYLRAINVLCGARLSEIRGASGFAGSLWRAFNPDEEVRWLRNVKRAVKREAERVWHRDYQPPFTGADSQVELLLQPKGVAATRRVEEARQRLQEEVLRETEGLAGEVPARVAEMLRVGWETASEGGAAERHDWFDYLCAFFVYELKVNEQVRSVFEGKLLAGLSAENASVTQEALLAQIESGGKTILRHLERVESALSGQGLELREVRESVSGMLPTLAVIPSLEEQVRAVAQSVNRRHLYERYAGREIAALVEERVAASRTDIFGREREWERLDELVERNDSGMLVLLAGAGFGKSSLLANWLTARHGEGCFIARHFFSRETTSLSGAYGNLLRQLYIYYEMPDEPLPNDPRRMRDIIFGLIQDFGARRDEPLVILIDALDEAEGPFPPPFPASLPHGVFVITSARASSSEDPEYLRGWAGGGSARVYLELLPRRAVADWLRGGDLAAHAADDDFINRLHELTGGYPLYLRFLVDELAVESRRGGDASLILAHTPNSFGAYVQEQFRQLARTEEVRRHRELQALFAVLSVARGPFPEQDVHELTGLSVWDLEGLPWQATRWLSIRRMESGRTLYSFPHQALAAEFKSALGRQADDAECRLMDYCAAWGQNGSRYALRYYPRHLVEAGKPRRLLALLTSSPAWMEEKFKTFGSHLLLVENINLALVAYRDPLSASQVLEVAQLHAALEVATEAASAHDDADLEILAWLGRADEALDWARMRDAATERVEGMALVRRVLQRKGEPTRAVLEEMAKTARAHPNDATVLSGVLKELASALASPSTDERVEELFADVSSLARSLQDGLQKIWVLCGAAAQASVGVVAALLEEAVAVMRSDASCVNGLALEALVGVGRADEAMEFAEALAPALRRAVHFGASAEAARRGDAETATRLFTSAAESAAADGGMSPFDVNSSTPALAALCEAGFADEALGLLRHFDERVRRRAVWQGFLSALAASGRAGDALALVHEAENDLLRFHRLNAIASGLSAPVNREEATAVFEEALAVALSLDGAENKDRGRSDLVKSLAQVNSFDRAAAILDTVESEQVRVEALAEMTRAMAKAGQTEQVEKNVSAIRQAGLSDKKKAVHLMQVAKALAESGQETLAASVYKTARSLPSAWGVNVMHIGSVLCALALTVHREGFEEQSRLLFDKAHESLSAEGMQRAREDLCVYLVVSLTTAGYFERAEQILTTVKRPGARLRGVLYLAEGLARAGQHERALELARAAGSEGSANPRAHRIQVDASRRLAEILLDAGEGEKAGAVIEEAVECARAGLEAGEAWIREPNVFHLFTDLILLAGASPGAERLFEAIIRKTALGGVNASHALADIAARLRCFDEAAEIAGYLEPPDQRVSALQEVVAIMREMGEYERADALSADLPPVKAWLAPFDDIIDLVNEGRLAQAFDRCRAGGLVGVIPAVTYWSPKLERLETGLSLKTLNEMVRIAAWTDKRWGEVGEILAAAVEKPGVNFSEKDERELSLVRSPPKLQVKGFVPTPAIRAGFSYMLGNVYSFGGLPHRAVEAYDRAISLRPHNPLYLQQRAWHRRLLGDLARAVEDLELAAELEPTDEMIGDLLVACLDAHDLEGAARSIERSFEISQDDSLGLYWRGVLGLMRGEPDAALVDFERSLGEPRGAQVNAYELAITELWEGVAHSLSGRAGEADTLFERVARLAPSVEDEMSRAKVWTLLSALREAGGGVPEQLTRVTELGDAVSVLRHKLSFKLLAELFPERQSVQESHEWLAARLNELTSR